MSIILNTISIKMQEIGRRFVTQQRTLIYVFCEKTFEFKNTLL